MKKNVLLLSFLLMVLANFSLPGTGPQAVGRNPLPANGWQSPPEDWLRVLHAPQYFSAWTAPGGKTLLLADPLLYPPLAELAAPMHKLAGMRVNPATNDLQGQHGATSPRLVQVESGVTIPLPLPPGAELLDVEWTADGRRFALIVGLSDRIGLWIGSPQGDLAMVRDIALNSLLGAAVSWHPDQQRLLIRAIPERGPAPQAPAIPVGPGILEGSGASARSTYEARNLLETAHDDALFDYFAAAELILFDPASGKKETIGKPAHYVTADYSPDGSYLLVERLVGPWSHEVPWWRFATEIEVWNARGELAAKIASLPLADQVPVHGVPLGPRSVSWRRRHADAQPAGAHPALALCLAAGHGQEHLPPLVRPG